MHRIIRRTHLSRPHTAVGLSAHRRKGTVHRVPLLVSMSMWMERREDRQVGVQNNTWKKNGVLKARTGSLRNYSRTTTKTLASGKKTASWLACGTTRQGPDQGTAAIVSRPPVANEQTEGWAAQATVLFSAVGTRRDKRGWA